VAASIEPEKTHVAVELKHGNPLTACRFDPTGRSIFAASEDETIQRWDLNGPTARAAAKATTYAAHDGWCFALALSPDGRALLSGGTDGKLIWWPAAAGAPKKTVAEPGHTKTQVKGQGQSALRPQPFRVVRGHDGWVRGLTVSPDGLLAASCGNDHRVRVWSMLDGRKLLDLPGHDKPVYRVAFVPGGKGLVSADLGGLVIQWDLLPGKEARRLDASKLHIYEQGQAVDYGGVRDLSFSHDGKYLACSGLINASNPLGAVSNPAVAIFDWKTGLLKVLQHPQEDVKGVAWGVRFHPAGFLVSASGGTSGGFLWFSQPDRPSEFFKLALPDTARDLDLHPGGALLATAHHDGILRISCMAAKPPAQRG
jgi:WD40 repeat protein